jgi:hypothetical protein
MLYLSHPSQETEEMLRNREMKELKKVLIQNEKANKGLATNTNPTPQKNLTKQGGEATVSLLPCLSNF